MINTITVIQLFIQCCKENHIPATPLQFDMCMHNEASLIFLFEYIIDQGYNEDALLDWSKECTSKGVDAWVEEAKEAWGQLTGEQL